MSRETKGRQKSFNKFCFYKILLASTPHLWWQEHFFPLDIGKSAVLWARYVLILRKNKGWGNSDHISYTYSFQVPLAQNNPLPKWHMGWPLLSPSVIQIR